MAKTRLSLIIISALALISFFGGYHNYLQANASHTPAVNRSYQTLGITSETTSTRHYSDFIDQWRLDYGVNVSIDPEYSNNKNFSWSIKGSQWQNSNITYYQVFDQELQKYSASFFNHIAINGIYFVDNITLDSGQAVLAFADVNTDSLYFNVDSQRADTELLRSTIHHELAHLIMYQYYGRSMYNLSSWPTAKTSLPDSTEVSSTNSFPSLGYVSQYAKTSVAEDMAEVYSYMMTDGLSTQLDQALLNDSILAKKVTVVKLAVFSLAPDFILPK